MKHRTVHRSAFSLVELVVVVVILGVISAIAVPRISSGSRRATVNALQTSVTNVRRAIDRYFAEHEKFPGYDPSTGSPDGSKFHDQLMKFTDAQGNASDTKTSVYKYGPYLRPPFPKNPTNDLDTVHAKLNPAAANPADGSVGWITDLATGDFGISASDAEIDKVVVDVGSAVDNVKKIIKLR